MEYLIGGVVAVIGLILLSQGIISIGGFFVFLFVGVFVVTVLLVAFATWEDSASQKKYELEMIARSAKAKATREKKLKNAIDAYPNSLEELHQNFSVISELDQDSQVRFYKKVEEICDYCTTLGKTRITEKDKLKEILIYARLNLLSFYENNKIDGAEKLADKVTKTIKKLK
jgi:CBS-domain-containing membrane protein